MHLSLPPCGCRLRHILPLFVVSMVSATAAHPTLAFAKETVDPGAMWAPSGPDEEPAPAQNAEPAVAEDDSVGQNPSVRSPARSPQKSVGKPKVAVVILHQSLGKPFDMSVINRVMEPLVLHSAFVPLPVVNRAVARTRLPPSLLHLPKNLQRVGRDVGADFTLVVEAVGRGRTQGVFVGLVDVHTGETTLAKRVPMPTRTLTNSQAIGIVDQLVSALDAGQGAAEEAPAPAVAEAPLAPQEAAEPLHAATDTAVQESVVGDANTQHGPRVARLMVGLALSQRVGHLVNTEGTGITPPQYAGSGNNTNPFFPGFQLDGEIFSGIATRHRRAWMDQFGLGLSLTLAPVLSYTTGSTEAKIKSTVVNLAAAFKYRILLMPHRSLSPDITVVAGLNHFAFPLTGAQFPGVAYTAPHLGLGIHVPVHKTLALNVEGGLRPGVSPGGEAKTLLGAKKSGFGFAIGGGLVASWKLLDVGLQAKYEKVAVSFSGPTKLNGTPVATGTTTPIQFNNIKLTDALLQFQLTAGIAY